MLTVYEGNEPYIFVSYAQADKLVAQQIIEKLTNEGYRVWSYESIEITVANRHEEIAEHVLRCKSFVMLISSSFLTSDHCNREVDYAFDIKKDRILPIYLEKVELTPGLHMLLSGRQALFWYKCDSDEAFYKQLFEARGLDCCLTEKGKSKRGVKPRSGSHYLKESHARREALKTVRTGVLPRRDSLDDYSWEELKVISRAIAAAESDEEWKTIVRDYGLVDADGKLYGAEKGFKLNNGTDSAVRILGFRHDEMADGTGTAGISFEFSGIPARHRMNAHWSNNGGWERSEMRTWLNNKFLKLLPKDLSANVAVVRKSTNKWGEIYESDDSAVTYTKDKLWILSTTEVYGKLTKYSRLPRGRSPFQGRPWLTDVYNAEGTQYQFYENMEVNLFDYSPCKKDGVHSLRWWLRSPCAWRSNRFHIVYKNGGLDKFHPRDDDIGVSPSFSF